MTALQIKSRLRYLFLYTHTNKNKKGCVLFCTCKSISGTVPGRGYPEYPDLLRAVSVVAENMAIQVSAASPLVQREVDLSAEGEDSATPEQLVLFPVRALVYVSPRSQTATVSVASSIRKLI